MFEFCSISDIMEVGRQNVPDVGSIFDEKLQSLLDVPLCAARMKASAQAEPFETYNLSGMWNWSMVKCGSARLSKNTLFDITYFLFTFYIVGGLWPYLCF